MLDEMSIDLKRDMYGLIIRKLMANFKKMYSDPYFAKKWPSKLSLATRINNGDCYAMALMVYEIARAYGLNPTVYAGGWHCWIQEDGYVFDAYFPDGITPQALESMKINTAPQDEDPSEPVFYQGGPSTKDVYGMFTTYFRNSPYRAVFVAGLLRLYKLDMPAGLRHLAKVRLTNYIPEKAKETKLWVGKRRRMQRYQYAMRRFIVGLRKEYGEVGLRLR